MLGDEIRNSREQAKMTQEALSFAANIDRSYVSLLENNHKSPTVELLFRICDALGVAPSELLARVEASRKPKTRKK
jgi:transcriptional regulator with XRE-family HTH domain